MKDVGLILSSNLRSETYFKVITGMKDIKISFVLLYGKKSKIIVKQKKIKNFYFFDQKRIDNKISKFIISQKIKNFIISPNFGEILKNKKLLEKKNLIHFHPGELPYFKGSTTLFYTLMMRKYLTCTGFILKKTLDSGKILIKQKFKIPAFKNEKDIIKFDNYMRSETLKNLIIKKKNFFFNLNNDNLDFFVIHPILRKLSFDHLTKKLIKKWIF